MWTCQADANSGGTITGVTVGPGLVGGGTTGAVTVSLPMTCAMGQLLKWNGSSWLCAADLDTISAGDITGITTGPASGLVGGVASGEATLSLLTNCTAGQLLKWSGTAWGCQNDIDTNSGGTITGITAGAGLTGGGTTGAVTVNVGAGTGITVAADTIALDTGFTDARYDARYDPRYVNATGDVMSGPLDMNQQRVVNRGCLAGYVRVGPGLCIERRRFRVHVRRLREPLPRPGHAHVHVGGDPVGQRIGRGAEHDELPG